jgi:predicted hotdog family 3-hydroxylacyl-ACP dehydratase
MNLPPVQELVPHAPPALLLDRVLSVDENEMVAEVVVSTDKRYCSAGRMGSWVGIEIMAQCTAALAGFDSWRNGEAIRIGFLLGARRYRCKVPYFSVGDRLLVHAQREFRAEGGVGAADCRIVTADGQLLAEALITVFHPDNPQVVLAGL